MDIKIIDSALKTSDIDNPTEQLVPWLSLGDLANTFTLWFTGKI